MTTETKQADFLTAGHLVTFTDGEYSDYTLGATFVALATVTFDEAQVIADNIKAKANAAEPKTGWYNGDQHGEFISALIARGWMLEVHATERHIGSYGKLKL